MDGIHGQRARKTLIPLAPVDPCGFRLPKRENEGLTFLCTKGTGEPDLRQKHNKQHEMEASGFHRRVSKVLCSGLTSTHELRLSRRICSLSDSARR